MIGVLRRHRASVQATARISGIVFVLFFVFALLPINAAEANPRYAAIVFDVNSGQTLFARNAEEPRFPASITKVMTLYVLFEELEAGRLRLDSPLRVSQFAADQAPSKIGVRPGTSITVKDAIGTLVTKSANDVAVVVAENVSGSVSAFADRMTRTARSIGMRNTTFRNPHGLPNNEQITTARDIVTLAIAIQRRFPQHYHFFGLRSYTHAGVTYRNHNRLLTQMAGVDGLKTGFIRASGFNLVASLRRDGRHIVGVVMGGRTGASRDAHMREILANALNQAQRGPSMHLSAAPLPRARPALRSPLTPAAQAAASILVPSTVVPATLVRAAPARQAQRTERPEDAIAALPPAPVQEEEAGSAEAVVVEEPAQRSRTGEWAIQIGAFNSEALARETLDRARNRASDVVAGAEPFTETVVSNGNTLWRARFAGFGQREAEAACTALKRADFACFATRN